MSQKQTKKTNLELKKPSELCQVLFYSDFNKKDYAYLTSLQIDLVSTIFYLISDVMNKQKLDMSIWQESLDIAKDKSPEISKALSYWKLQKTLVPKGTSERRTKI